jgi:DNA-binding NarL/FixJ family response regulator
VLIVDDPVVAEEAVDRALKAQPDMEVVERSPAVAGTVRTAREPRPRVLMGFELPAGKGTEAATVLITQEMPETKVVMMTGHADAAVLAATLESGCIGFVSNGGDFQELLMAIRAVLAGDVRVPPAMIGQLAEYLRPWPAAIGPAVTKRELEVLRLLAQGKSTAVIMKELFLSIHTVRNHVRNILMKLHAQSRLEAVAVATRQGLISEIRREP